MKRLIMVFVLIVFSVAVCVASCFYVSAVANEAGNYVQKAEQSVSASLYKSALGEVGSLEDYWEENQFFLAMILHHEMLEEIDGSIAVMKYSLEHHDEDFTDFWVSAAQASKRIENLKKCETPSLENVL